MMKKIFYSTVAIALAVAIFTVIRPKSIKVETVIIKKGDFIESLSADAKVRSRNKQTVYAFATGNIENLKVKLGDAVVKGQVLTILEWDRTLKVVSPMSGVLSKVYRDSAGPVNRGEALFEVSSLNDLEIVAEVLTPDAIRLKEKGTAKILNWGGEGELLAHITQISRAGVVKLSALGVEEERTEVRLTLEKTPNELQKRIGDNYHVDVVFQISKEEAALAVPLGALFKNADNWAVYVVENNRAKLQEISISKKNDRMALVDGGLSEGQIVILFPGDKIRNGVRVQPATVP